MQRVFKFLKKWIVRIIARNDSQGIKIACNEFVLVIRDKTETEKGGMLLSSGGREKPHFGTIHAAGRLVKDKKIRRGKGRKCLFHAGTGWEIDYEEVTYLVLQDREIIALP